MAKILLVDDSPAVLVILGQCIKGAGYTVATSVSGEDALARLATEQFDLVVLDIIMQAGSMDGYAVLDHLATNAPPVILVTGGLVDEKKFQSHKPARFWQKSYPPSQLVAIIGEVLGNQPPA